MTEAAVCSRFTPSGARWPCTEVADTAPAGRAIVYYTHVRSARATTVEHVWYRDGAETRRVRLSVGANPGAGYRTYSRTTVGAGAWRVELRVDGVVHHAAAFTVP